MRRRILRPFVPGEEGDSVVAFLCRQQKVAEAFLHSGLVWFKDDGRVYSEFVDCYGKGRICSSFIKASMEDTSLLDNGAELPKLIGALQSS